MAQQKATEIKCEEGHVMAVYHDGKLGLEGGSTFTEQLEVQSYMTGRLTCGVCGGGGKVRLPLARLILS
jgi:hypothetical protein